MFMLAQYGKKLCRGSLLPAHKELFCGNRDKLPLKYTKKNLCCLVKTKYLGLFFFFFFPAKPLLVFS